ncbi:chitobiase/beta-hexosaminidase C-terminal domain-containing protein [Rudanella lutea]|uniref:chitobiase/beta-hexosaminidase C-terminal domain-containing protein n=1 Tax=Rudanella lutea TaxID=451374 RepID=UPI000376AA82|nr:chitobiase/beta-hexosaminidase C-terminal domain-containing protein [Rudanella lutea]
MRRFQAVTANVLLALNLLLLFLLIFQEKVVLPGWLQPVGRMHPMLLHLPIGLLVLVAVLWVFRRAFAGEGVAQLFRFLLIITALSASVAALMGFFLSREGGYTDNLLNWHKYTGVGMSLLAYALVVLNERSESNSRLFSPVLGLSTLCLFVTGHFGASLTHGEDYLFPNEEVVPEMAFTDDTPVFVSTIEPILKTKCYQCHNEQKQKGELLMSTMAGLLKGGKNGPIWVAGDPLNSHMIQRANLPLEDKKHMPPKGKAQLSPDEVGLLTAWIKAGADTKKSLGALAQNDPLRALVLAHLNAKRGASVTEAVAYDFDAASEEALEKVNTPFRVVVPLAHDSPALQASFFVREAYKPEHLAELSDVKQQLVSLNLTNMPVRDEDMKTIAQFENLEKLILNNSEVTGKTLADLKSLTKLNSLALSGTKVNKDALAALSQLPHLKEVFVWNTPLGTAELAQLQRENKGIRFVAGYIPSDTERLKLNPPMLVNEQFVVTAQTPVTFKHPLPGVQIRYTTDGSEPDTLKSPVYQKPFAVNGFTVVKARATKDKWYASELVEYTFFGGQHKPAQAELVNQPNPQYLGEGGKTLIDGKKGTIENFKDVAWLGFREKPFEAFFSFARPVPLKSVTLSIGKNTGSYIMPPNTVEVWGGPDKAHLKLVRKIQPTQPQKEESGRIEGIQAALNGETCAVVKIVARPVTKLPAWHPGKGQPGWVFVDEVFFN